jgi:hypothetical protein
MDTDRAHRFRDPLVWLYDLAAENIDVVCPRCEDRALVVAQRDERVSMLRWSRRFVCTACASTASWSPGGRGSVWGVPVDPFFRLPLWLRADFRGGRVVWAFNDAHLTLLEDFVSSGLRERGADQHRLTLVARLPAWWKSAKNREDLLRVIARLRALADGRRARSSANLGQRLAGGVSVVGDARASVIV